MHIDPNLPWQMPLIRPNERPDLWTGRLRIVRTQRVDLIKAIHHENHGHRDKHGDCLNPETLVLTTTTPKPRHKYGERGKPFRIGNHNADYEADIREQENRDRLETPSKPHETTTTEEPKALLTVRCGRCAPCKRHRARTWMARGIKEGECSPRTWSLTTTLPPNFFWQLPKSEWDAAILKEGQMAIKRLRERIRPSGRSFRHLLTVEVHTAKRTPDGRPTKQTGHLHLHILVHELPGMRLTNDELELAWCRWPKFEAIPDDAETAMKVAEAKGYKLGHVECHLERTTDPRDAPRSNAYGRPAKEGVGYTLKYLFKQSTDEQEQREAALAQDRNPDPWERPKAVRASLHYGKGCFEALGLIERSRVQARITRRLTREAAASQSAGGAAPAEVRYRSPPLPPHCHVGSKEQGATPWNSPYTCNAWIESVMQRTRESYETQVQPKLIAAIKAMTQAQGP